MPKIHSGSVLMRGVLFERWAWQDKDDWRYYFQFLTYGVRRAEGHYKA